MSGKGRGRKRQRVSEKAGRKQEPHTQSSCHVVVLTEGGMPDQLNFRSSPADQTEDMMGDHGSVRLDGYRQGTFTNLGQCWVPPGASQTFVVS